MKKKKTNSKTLIFNNKIHWRGVTARLEKSKLEDKFFQSFLLIKNVLLI